jgi:ribosomal-protein-serine acetyltransferase
MDGPVSLREWTPSDVDTLYELVHGAHETLRQWMPWAVGEYTREDAAAFLSRSAQNRSAGEVYAYAIVVAGTPVGTVGMERNEFPDAMEIGYWLHPAHTGHGYATLAAALVVEKAFALPWVRRVQIWHDAANEASSGVPRRLGFTEVARRTPPREPAFGGEVGIDVIWELTTPPRGRPV